MNFKCICITSFRWIVNDVSKNYFCMTNRNLPRTENCFYHFFYKQGQIPNHLSLRTFLFPIFCFFKVHFLVMSIIYFFPLVCGMQPKKRPCFWSFLFNSDSNRIQLEFSCNTLILILRVINNSLCENVISIIENV